MPGGSRCHPQLLSPGPGRGGAAVPLWLWGAGPLLLLLLTGLAVLGRDRDTGRGTRGMGTPGAQATPYLLSPAVPWECVSPDATSLVSPGGVCVVCWGGRVRKHRVTLSLGHGAGGGRLVSWGAPGGGPVSPEGVTTGCHTPPCAQGGASLMTPRPMSRVGGGGAWMGGRGVPGVPRVPRVAVSHLCSPPQGCDGREPTRDGHPGGGAESGAPRSPPAQIRLRCVSRRWGHPRGPPMGRGGGTPGGDTHGASWGGGDTHAGDTGGRFGVGGTQMGGT